MNFNSREILVNKKFIQCEVSVKDYGIKDYKTFTYQADKDMGLKVGSVVFVPFGRKTSLGVVTKMISKNQPKPAYKILDIKEKIDISPLPSHLVKLASWMADYYPSSPKAVW